MCDIARYSATGLCIKTIPATLNTTHSFLFPNHHSHTNPSTPASKEAASTPVFAISKYSGCSAKPSSAMKIDMVKPMPPSTDTAAI